MQGAQVIVLATPVFLLLIAVEWLVGLARARNTYRLADAMNSIGLGIISQIAGVFTRLATIGIYSLVFAHFSLWQLPADAWWVWLLALLGYDLAYYWLHRAGHRVALFWAAHVVHHQSEDYNLSTALRQTGSGWIAGWIFYLPLAVLGVPPLVFAVVALIDLLYQFWVHTQQVGKLGWFDRWFCSPSNHRAHHAVNERCLDRNYGVGPAKSIYARQRHPCRAWRSSQLHRPRVRACLRRRTLRGYRRFCADRCAIAGSSTI